MQDLRIVWRNPSPHRIVRHWRMKKSEFSSGIYIVQELIAHGTTGCWASTSALEIHAGGQPLRQNERSICAVAS
jgi:hypothetical protein